MKIDNKVYLWTSNNRRYPKILNLQLNCLHLVIIFRILF